MRRLHEGYCAHACDRFVSVGLSVEHTNISSLRPSYLVMHAVLQISGRPIPISCQSSARGTCSAEHL